ncbi:hypothetical protein [Kitasatospora sp. NPDC088783]|uniref:hypothetical protein n=1 Tax=Kitasatospora sp. NPDC088783 TaxID=3364077 RepID=UPI00382CE19B
MDPTPSPREASHLRTASKREDGVLPDTVSPLLLARMLESGLVARLGADGAPLPVSQALAPGLIAPCLITPLGRASVLTASQRATIAALATHRLAEIRVAWQTYASLVELRLVKSHTAADDRAEAESPHPVPALTPIGLSVAGLLSAA